MSGEGAKSVRGTEVPDAVELCVRGKDRFRRLSAVHRIEPDGHIYCMRCRGNEPGAVYVRQAS